MSCHQLLTIATGFIVAVTAASAHLAPFTLDDVNALLPPVPPVAGVTNSTVQVITRDNVSLNSYLYLPSAVPVGGVPLVLLRTPYNAVGLMAQAAAYAAQGYAAIAQDFRGRFGSGGTIAFLAM